VKADDQPARLAPVRRRVAVAKAGLAIVGAAVFGAAFALSRVHNPSHPKLHLRPLAASPGYLAEVRAHLGDAGIIVPPLSSPAAATRQT
jgi:hypothetical protein